MASPRVLKLADQIKVIIAEMLERRIKDPRLGFVTITDVRLTGDSREATAFYTVLGAVPENARQIDELLAQARATDERVAEQAATAAYAAGEDPYKHPDGDEEPIA